MKHPIVWAGSAGLVVLAVALVPPLWQALRAGSAPVAAVTGQAGGLPWQVQVQADGSATLMGLHLGRDTLGDVQATLGDNLQLALVAHLGEVGVLEALVEPFSAGFVTGRLVLAFDAPPDQLRRWREAASGSTPMDGGLRRFALRSADITQARSLPLAGLSFVPGVRLTEADVRQRFGPPAQQQALAGGAVLMAYPAQGLSITVAPGQRGVIQAVAPRDWARRLGASAAGATAGQAAASVAASTSR